MRQVDPPVVVHRAEQALGSIVGIPAVGGVLEREEGQAAVSYQAKAVYRGDRGGGLLRPIYMVPGSAGGGLRDRERGAGTRALGPETCAPGGSSTRCSW